MRVADKMNFDQVNSGLSRSRQELSELQNQAATQKRVTKPSDDPLGSARVLATRTEVNGNQQYVKSIGNAKAFLEYSEQSLAEMSDTLMRAKELAISQSNDASANAKSRLTTSTEIEQLYNQAIQVGNRKLGDRFLFGGFKTTKPPFDQNGDYHGDNGQMEILINKEAKVAMNMPGSHVFLGYELKNESQRGDARPGSNSQLKSAPNIDETRTPYTIQKSQEQAPAEAGRQPASLRINEKSDPSSQPVNAKEEISNQGANVFQVLKSLEIALKTNDKAAIQDSLEDIDKAIAQVIMSRSALGSRIGTLNSASESLQKGTIDAKTMASNLEDADTFELVSEMNKSESTLKATLQTSGKLIQPSLLDFIR